MESLQKNDDCKYILELKSSQEGSYNENLQQEIMKTVFTSFSFFFLLSGLKGFRDMAIGLASVHL